MKHPFLIVDGMLSGTGLRDSLNGGYVKPSEVGISEKLQRLIADWLLRYENAHFHGYEDEQTNDALDREGVEIAKQVKTELPDVEVRYFSDAYMREIKF